MTKKAFRPDVDAPEWRGGYSPYDIIKEGTIAIVVVGLLTILLSTFFGSSGSENGYAWNRSAARMTPSDQRSAVCAAACQESRVGTDSGKTTVDVTRLSERISLLCPSWYGLSSVDVHRL